MVGFLRFSNFGGCKITDGDPLPDRVSQMTHTTPVTTRLEDVLAKTRLMERAYHNPTNHALTHGLVAFTSLLELAAQQGKYLAKGFNQLNECEQKPEGLLRFIDTGPHHIRPFSICEVDTKMKSLPPTEHLAAQQGKYLAKGFNQLNECEQKPEGLLRFIDTGPHHIRPFRYTHLSQFAPLGGE
nr:external alternative NAD(P)H-ubiquinone oxidoreductase B2, mitochondrial-like [Tanacetum cinerariifolium]